MLVSGYHAIEEYLRREAAAAQPARAELLLDRSNSRIDRLEELARRTGVPVRRVESRELDRLAGGADHRGALLLLEGVGPSLAKRRQSGGFAAALAAIAGPTALVLLLDELNDPRNFGAILRSADQFAVDLVVASFRRSVRETEAVLKSSSGASLYVPLATVPNLVAAMGQVKEAGFWIYGADLSGEPLDRLRFEGRVALVMGSEGSGLRRLVRERCDALARIPTAGHVDSLNVSVAAGILIYEIRRQQGFAGYR